MHFNNIGWQITIYPDCAINGVMKKQATRKVAELR